MNISTRGRRGVSKDIVADQESWEKEDTRISVEGYKWFGKARSYQNSQRGEGGVGFLVHDCLANSRNSITVVPIGVKLDIWTSFGKSQGLHPKFLC